jgi:hypothetical protein
VVQLVEAVLEAGRSRVRFPMVSSKFFHSSLADFLSFTQNLIAYDISLHRKRNEVIKHVRTQTAVAHD